MPVLIAAAASSAILGSIGVSAGTTIIGSLTVGGALTSLLSTGMTFGLQQLLTPKPKKTTRTEQITARDSNPVRLGGYGRNKTGGSTFYLNAQWGAFLWVGIVHGEGPFDAFEEWWCNDTKTQIADGSLGGFVGVQPWVANVRVESHLGAADQTVSPLIAGSDETWTANHRLRGLAYSVQFSQLPPKPEKNFQKVFPNGNPSLRVVARWWQVLDVRSGAVGWSQNPALCIRDYMTRQRVDAVTGKAWRYIDPVWIDDASFGAFADLCDQPVPLAKGGTEPRYRLDGTFDMNEEPKDVLRRMLATCDAELVPLGSGKIGIKGGAWEEPNVVLTEDMFLGYTYTQANQKLSAWNQLKWTFTDHRNDYQQIDGDPWDDPEDASPRLTSHPAEFGMVQSHTQGRRLAKIATAKGNPRHRLTGAIVKLPALALLDEAVVRVKMPTLGLDAVFTINRMEPAGDFTTVSLDLSSISASAYAWNPAAEEGTPPSAPVASGEEYNAPPIEGMSIELVRTQLSTGVYLAQVRATSDPAGGATPQYWTLAGQIRIVGGGEADWQDMSAETGGALISAALSDGFEYEVRLHWTGLGVVGEWSSLQSLLVTSDQVAPGIPLGLVANGGTGNVMIAWTQPDSANTAGARVYRAAGDVAPFDSATRIRSFNAGPGVAREFVDPVPSGPYRYWVAATNGSGVEGEAAGPIDTYAS